MFYITLISTDTNRQRTAPTYILDMTTKIQYIYDMQVHLHRGQMDMEGITNEEGSSDTSCNKDDLEACTRIKGMIYIYEYPHFL